MSAPSEARPTWYVAPHGNDAWSGSLPAPNAAKDNGPFASLEVALEASRKEAGKARRVVLTEGRFYLPKALALDGRR